MTENLTVSTAWLAEHLDDPNVRIVDIRGHVISASQPHPHYFAHHDEYLQSHIPGAVFVDWVRDITDPDSPNASQIAPPDAYAELMSRLGISDDTLVIAYDDADSMFAARLWWTLRVYGHENVRVLDGGWKAWLDEGRPVTADIPDVPAGSFTVRPNPSIRRSADEVAGALHSDTILLDVRSVGEFAGEASRAKRGGHIPGAVNVPRGTVVNTDGTLPDADMLKTKFASAGLDNPDAEVVVYCNGGVSASYGMMALINAGFTDVAVYDGSWKEWGNDDSRPIE
ncbi:MAG: sulfurtransferase [Aggregatilineales bacterium]